MLIINFKLFFVLKYIKIIFFFIFKKLFLRSVYQNNLKYKKLIFNKNNYFFKTRCINLTRETFYLKKKNKTYPAHMSLSSFSKNPICHFF